MWFDITLMSKYIYIYFSVSRRNTTFWSKVGETGVGEMGVGKQGPIRLGNYYEKRPCQALLNSRFYVCTSLTPRPMTVVCHGNFGPQKILVRGTKIPRKLVRRTLLMKILVRAWNYGPSESTLV